MVTENENKSGDGSVIEASNKIVGESQTSRGRHKRKGSHRMKRRNRDGNVNGKDRHRFCSVTK